MVGQHDSRIFTADKVSRCLANGADPNFRWSRTGVSALHYACLCIAPDIVDMLLQAGGDVHALDDFGRTPLACVVEVSPKAQWVSRQVHCVRSLVEHGADVSWAKQDFSGDTVLHIASEYASAQAVRLLLSFGADPVARNKEGRTPLSRAVQRTNTLEPALVLLEARGIGPDDPIPGFGGKTVGQVCRSQPELLDEIERWRVRLRAQGAALDIERQFGDGSDEMKVVRKLGCSI